MLLESCNALLLLSLSLKPLLLLLLMQPDVAGEVKLNGLLALYTSCPTDPTRYLVLLQLLAFAQQSKQLATLLAPVIKVGTCAAVVEQSCLSIQTDMQQALINAA
jgi:hypothetical protein